MATKRWSARNAETGIELPLLKSEANAIAEATSILMSNLNIETKPKSAEVHYLLGKIYGNNYDGFERILNKIAENTKVSPCSGRTLPCGVYHKNIWLDLVSMTQKFPYSATKFELNINKQQLPPSSQLVVLDDNTKTKSSIILQNGKNLNPSKITAELKIQLKDITRPLTLVPSNSNTSLALDFPSLAALGVNDIYLDDSNKVIGSSLSLNNDQIYEDIFYQRLVTPLKHLVKVNSGASKVTQDKGAGSITLHFNFEKVNKIKLADYVEVTLDGADMDSAKDKISNTSIVLKPGSIVTVKDNSSVKFTLRNLESNTKIKFKIIAKKGATKIGDELSVEIPIK